MDTQEYQQKKAANKVIFIDKNKKVTTEESQAVGFNYLSKDESLKRTRSGKWIINNDQSLTISDWLTHASQSFSSNEALHVANTMFGALQSQEQSLNAEKNNITEKRGELVKERETISDAIKEAQSKIKACQRENKELEAGNQYSLQQPSFNESQYGITPLRLG